jgi:hypothetical protein
MYLLWLHFGYSRQCSLITMQVDTSAYKILPMAYHMALTYRFGTQYATCFMARRRDRCSIFRGKLWGGAQLEL